MSSEIEIEEIRRELRLEIDRLRREQATQRQALIQQEGTIAHQKAEIDELYRCAEASAERSKQLTTCLNLFNESLGIQNERNNQTAGQLEMDTILSFNGLIYLEDLVCDLYDRLLPHVNIAMNQMRRIVGPPALDHPNWMHDPKRTQ